MKKKLTLIIAAVALVGAAVVGGSLASYETGGLKALETIELKDAKIALAASPDFPTKESIDGIKAMPGDTFEFENAYYVENPTRDNYTVYTRVTIDKQWENAELSAGLITLSLGDKEDWIIDDSDPNAEQVIMYYKHPLAVEEHTNDFLTGISFSKDMDNAYSEAKATITITVDAVQAAVIQKSMVAEWGVYPVFAEDNETLMAIEE